MKKSHHLFVIITKNTYFCPRNKAKGYQETDGVFCSRFKQQQSKSFEIQIRVKEERDLLMVCHVSHGQY